MPLEVEPNGLLSRTNQGLAPPSPSDFATQARGDGQLWNSPPPPSRSPHPGRPSAGPRKAAAPPPTRHLPAGLGNRCAIPTAVRPRRLRDRFSYTWIESQQLSTEPGQLQIHRLASLDGKQRSSLAGELAYAFSVEPDLENRLILKYGTEVVAQAKRAGR